MVSELHDVHMVCLLKTIIPEEVTTTIQFTLAIDYVRIVVRSGYYKPWLNLFFFSPAHRNPRTLNKQYPSRNGLYFHVFNLRW